ncbi:patatin-like phospholipase family protein [Parafrigoribacterium soli]|uniref:patatin-like phospholipase family protein n=1 Tax=Parafrigoribacterium soli TaxID=3144663 RepID=UPI0032EC446B
MNTTPSSPQHPTSSAAAEQHGDAPRARALVLGGGGSTGNAWLIGIVAGLFDAGLDVTQADLTIGTSAGSTAAAQFAGASPAELFATTVEAVPPQQRSVPPRMPGAARTLGTDPLARLQQLIASSSDLPELRRRVAAAALEADAASDGSWSEKWRATVATRFRNHEWPQRRVLITAIDAHSAQPVVFDRHSGVDLVDAVAASCAGGGFPYRIGDRTYLDGGYRINAENADLATGYERVLVLSPFGGRTLHPLEWGTGLAVQVDVLRAAGSHVEVVGPDAASEHLFGPNAMDFSLRPAAARAGYEQGTELASRLAEFWV